MVTYEHNGGIRGHRITDSHFDYDMNVSYQNIVDKAYSTNDILQIFRSLRIDVVNHASKIHADISHMNPWASYINGTNCNRDTPTRSIKCLGCVLTSRFNPKGLCTNCSFKLKSDKMSGEEFVIVATSTSPFEGYNELRELPDLCMFDGDFKHVTKHMVTNNRHEHSIFMGMLTDSIMECGRDETNEVDQIVYSYRCRDNTIDILRSYNYGRGTLSVLEHNEFTSHIGIDGIRYLNDEIVEGIIFQLHHILSSLVPYMYTHGRQTIEYLGFSDTTCSTSDRTYSFTMHLLCSGDDTIVRNGMIYYYRPHEYKRMIDDRNKNKDFAEIAEFHRKHSGWNVEPGKVDFYNFIKSLRAHDIFERSLRKLPTILSIVDSRECWDELQRELDT